MKIKKTIYFSTSSEIKFKQYELIFKDLGFSLKRCSVPSSLIEPQLNEDIFDYSFVVEHPLKYSSRFIKNEKPFLIEDTILEIGALSNPEKAKFGLPGADTKNWWKNLEDVGILKLIENKSDRSAKFTSVIGVYINKERYIYSYKTVTGTISIEPKISKIAFDQIPRTNPYFFHSIFIPDGSNHTYAEMESVEFEKFDYRRKNVLELIKKLPNNFTESIPEDIQLNLGF